MFAGTSLQDVIVKGPEYIGTAIIAMTGLASSEYLHRPGAFPNGIVKYVLLVVLSENNPVKVVNVFTALAEGTMADIEKS